MKDSLINKLYNKDKEIKQLKQTVELISTKGEGDAKEKKIIELAKKVRAMNLQLQSYKTKAAQAMQHALDAKTQQTKTSKLLGKIQQNDQNQDPSQQNKQLSTDDLKKKIKDADKRIAKLRNQNVQLKTDYDKAYRALQKEVAVQSGAKVNVDEIIRNPESGWKGRAQQINLLKSKLKSSAGMDSTTMSAFPQQSVLISQRKVEENLGKMGSNKAKIIQELSSELQSLRKQNKDLKLKYSGAQSRKNTLEGEIKGIKTDYSLKMKVLLDKTQTDDKLIKALKEQLQRAGGGTKSKVAMVSQGKSSMNQQEVSKILVQNANLRSQKIKLQTSLKKKTMEIQNFLQDKMLNYQQSKSKTKDRSSDKQKIMLLQNEIADLKQKQRHLPKTEQDLLIKDLTKQNINFRKKIDDLTIRLASYNEK